jgi:hypothetical protein
VIGRRLLTTGIALGFLLPAPAAISADADRVRYLAWHEHLQAATIATSTGTQQIELGDPVPGFGTVVELDAMRVVLRKVLSDHERASLAARGYVRYGARDLEVIREDLAIRLVPVR